MPIIIQDQPRPQKQEKESILELLGRGFATGAGQSLGTGLGQLATQGLGSLMDPNMRPLSAQSLEMLGLDPNQAKSVASIRNPAVQRDIVNSMQTRKVELQEKERKQRLASQYAQQVAQITGQNISGDPVQQSQQGEQKPIQLSDVDEIVNDLSTMKDLGRVAQKQREFEQKEKHAYSAEIRQSHQDNKKFTSKGRQRAEGAEEGEGIVNAMESLEKTGKVESGPWAELLSKYGLDAFLNPESIAFEKLRATFLGGAKNIIGGRVTNQEMQQFMKSIPSLSQSPEGRALIYANMRNKFELDRQYYQTIQDVENEYQGKPLPYNFESIVHERMKPHYKTFQDKFKTMEDVANEGPPAAQFKDQVRRDKQTGRMQKSNGVEWIDVAEGMPQAQTQKMRQTPFMSTGNKIGKYPWQQK